MTPKIIYPESDEQPSSTVDYYLADIALKDFPISIKRSFLVLIEQALKTGSEALEFEIMPDGKAHIALVRENKTLPIVTISSGIFDRYWEFLSTALNSPSGFKIKKGDEIFILSGGTIKQISGRKITIRISGPHKKEDFFDTSDKI